MTRIKPQANSTSKTSKRPIKTAGYSSGVLRATKAAKRAEAEERQARYDNLSLEAKIKLTGLRRGNSTREFARLKAKSA